MLAVQQRLRGAVVVDLLVFIGYHRRQSHNLSALEVISEKGSALTH